MIQDFPHDILEDVDELAGFRGWDRDVYQDFLAIQRGELSERAFREKYSWRRAILSLDMTDFTSSAMRGGELDSLLRIFDAQKVCVPVLKEFDAELIRCFADDMVALFEDPMAALNAAFEIHRRIRLFNESPLARDNATECCIGIGYGDVLAIGPNLSQGTEMVQASKLGEDIARANEVLLTESAYQAMAGRDDVEFERQAQDDQLFPFYRAIVKK
jgi:class 3 adenylate cyclase